ncbi:hypothetical protein OGAPHI_001989 [Ogataea philodendri]|uniref:Uncharacterized protein n=1 Tax=Ogataea philodendri TaxID=1378263 RepID=A0A9P8PAL1_9ASCO|nr:uncharacterized protein OGAPHI_001989 [Ogataea philodendri]KAH3668235.1 hypothetical protein OGAPHI_001989 [Ogataea philodendri]
MSFLSDLNFGSNFLGVGHENTSAGSDKLGSDEASRFLADPRNIEQSDVTRARELVESGLQSISQSLDTGVRQSLQVNSKSLGLSWWISSSQDLNNLWVREPFWDMGALAQTLSELGTGNVQGSCSVWNTVDRSISGLVRQVCHHSEWNNLDFQFVSKPLNKLLGIVRSVEWNSLRVGSWTGVVSSHDEVGSTIVLSDNGVPNSFSVTGHSHGKRQQSKLGHSVWILLDDLLVHLDSGVVVDVTRLGESNNRVDQQVGKLVSSGTHGKLSVSSVHWVSGLESNHLLPVLVAELGPQLSRSLSEPSIVVVFWSTNGLQRATNINVPGGVQQIPNSRVLRVTTEHLLGLDLLVWSVDVVDGQNSQSQIVSWVSQHNTLAGLQTRSHIFGNVQGDRNGPDLSGSQTHLVHNRGVVGLVQESR